MKKYANQLFKSNFHCKTLLFYTNVRENKRFSSIFSVFCRKMNFIFSLLEIPKPHHMKPKKDGRKLIFKAFISNIIYIYIFCKFRYNLLSKKFQKIIFV